MYESNKLEFLYLCCEKGPWLPHKYWTWPKKTCQEPGAVFTTLNFHHNSLIPPKKVVLVPCKSFQSNVMFVRKA